VTMQYSLRPSPLSLDRVAEGRMHYRMLIDAIHNAIKERPAAKRPRVVLFGESLGAWTSQDAFAHRGTQGLLDAGIDRAIWIGTPYMSKWKEKVLKDNRPDVDRSLVGRFNDFGELQALDPEARQRLRYVMVTHANDAVGHLGLDLLVRAPAWLGPAEGRAATVPGAQQWPSPTSFVQTLVDMKNAANVVPGQFEAKGHDYRADLARFVREVYALAAGGGQGATSFIMSPDPAPTPGGSAWQSRCPSARSTTCGSPSPTWSGPGRSIPNCSDSRSPWTLHHRPMIPTTSWPSTSCRTVSSWSTAICCSGCARWMPSGPATVSTRFAAALTI
jgi:Alpha/beta-hydrolase family